MSVSLFRLTVLLLCCHLQCLVKETRQRPSIEQMSKHAFLKLHKSTNLSDVLTWAMGDS
jgi:hypothetical protein